MFYAKHISYLKISGLLSKQTAKSTFFFIKLTFPRTDHKMVP